MRQKTFLLIVAVALIVTILGETKTPIALAQTSGTQTATAEVPFLTVEDLKARMAKGEPITIIDVRGSSDLHNGDNKIKGAIYVKLRKLKSRLAFPPLKDVPKDREIVAYCSCPNDEASIRAAQLLNESGFKRARVLKGGWVAWKRANGAVEPLSKVM
ncbi:MAG TPA: rhodanese-like domain-containing protein [Pyrinomonadaceae bacterium]|nr:rhodanese-like domain-containing protein [Pyrinomonadaceae bacterium]